MMWGQVLNENIDRPIEDDVSCYSHEISN